MTDEPKPTHDYELVAHHRFESVYQQTKDDEEMAAPDPEEHPELFVEKVVWVFRCRHTGELREVVHSGPVGAGE